MLSEVSKILWNDNEGDFNFKFSFICIGGNMFMFIELFILE